MLPNQLAQGTLSVGSQSVQFKVGTATGDSPQPTGDPLIVLIRHPVSDTSLLTTRVLSPATGASTRIIQNGFQDTQTWINSEPFSGNSFNAFLVGAGGTRLIAGNYTSVSQYGSAAQPSLYSNETACASEGNLSLNVSEIEVDANDVVTKLALDFAQGLTPASNTQGLTPASTPASARRMDMNLGAPMRSTLLLNFDNYRQPPPRR